MKKTYFQPLMEIVKAEPSSFVCGSGTDAANWGDGKFDNEGHDSQDEDIEDVGGDGEDNIDAQGKEFGYWW